MNKVEDVMAIEQELVEHIDMIKLAREENDPELELVILNLFIAWNGVCESVKALLRIRRNVKQKELEALLSREHDCCSCYIEPYHLVKDLRTNYEVSDPDSVLEGDLDDFILSFLSSSLDKDEE
ncbi:hypothetical protein P3S68_017183 [Capsicum galapagoense]